MTSTLVTGASGFVGSHVARALAGRGDELRLMARRGSSLDHLGDLDFERATGDIRDRRAVRRAMAGVERVFHVAGRTSLRPEDRAAVFEANVRGARVIFESALEAGVERVVHTSSVGAIGVAPSREKAIDESAVFDIGHLGIAYVNSKHEAELEALRACARGLDVVIVNPSFALGPNAPSGSSMGLVKRFLLRRIPAYVNGGLNIVDVRDVAQGHLLADVKGVAGERYILSGRNFTLDRLFADLARISGVEPPAVKLPGQILAGMLAAGSMARLPVPSSADEVRSGMLWWNYRNTRAKQELGFKPRPQEETLEAAVAWQAAQLGDRVARAGGAERLAMGVLDMAMRLGERVTGR
ncbi:MAG: NAD-dependent epimerase/dehydratase family protein [Actinomycetota bacterium]|nr:NAD-dependent epimerase/dehydratase family protein [Actinomycetota bacterium]